MGAWAASAFENDDASDWVYGLEVGTVDVVRSGLAVTESDYRETGHFFRPNAADGPLESIT